MAAPTALLSMQGVCKHFGATAALREVDLSVSSGQALALVGENGAGKSTLMKILSGAHRADAGQMRLEGRPYQPRGPLDALRAGVAMIYQELNLAPHLSIEDNIMLGQEHRRWGFVDRSSQRREVQLALARLGHADLDPDTLVERLSIGTRQLVEIARALVMRAKVIVFDEPTSSLPQHDAQRLFEVIHRLRQSGLAIIYISHFLEEVRNVCSSYVVLRDGRVAGSGLLNQTSEAEIVALMAGRSVDDLFPQVPHQSGDVLLELDRLTGRRQPHDVSLELRRGEILGIGGLIGAGRTELLRCLFALDPVRRGRVRIGGTVPGRTSRKRIEAGMALVSEDRKHEGLAQSRSIADNMTYSRLEPYQRWGWLNLARRRRAVECWIERLDIKARWADQEVQHLSGGNQQKVALARAMHQDADILLLDEPTRGIDVATKATIYRLMGELAAEGKSILFVSSYFSELLHVCDRVGVMSRGRLREIRPASGWTEHSLLERAIEVNPWR